MIKKIILIPIGIAVFIFGGTWIVMSLWNYAVPGIFSGIQPLGFYQAMALLLLCKILFGSFGGGRHKWGKGGHKGAYYWKDKWKNLSEEERNKMRDEWKTKWKC